MIGWQTYSKYARKKGQNFFRAAREYLIDFHSIFLTTSAFLQFQHMHLPITTLTMSTEMLTSTIGYLYVWYLWKPIDQLYVFRYLSTNS